MGLQDSQKLLSLEPGDEHWRDRSDCNISEAPPAYDILQWHMTGSQTQLPYFKEGCTPKLLYLEMLQSFGEGAHQRVLNIPAEGTGALHDLHEGVSQMLHLCGRLATLNLRHTGR